MLWVWSKFVIMKLFKSDVIVRNIWTYTMEQNERICYVCVVRRPQITDSTLKAKSKIHNIQT